MNCLPFRASSALLNSGAKSHNLTFPGSLGSRSRTPLPIPHRTIPQPKGQDLDFVTVAYSHLVHSDWENLETLVPRLTPFRIKHILLKVQRDSVLSLEFFKWVQLKKLNSITLDTYSVILHILTKSYKFKSAESILKSVVASDFLELPSKLFEAILFSYRLCDSSPRVFNLLFQTYARMKKLRSTSDTFCLMKDYGFLPAVESCNVYLSSLLDLQRTDIALAFYREMRRCWISPNVYTINMVICALCKSGKVEKAVEVLGEMETMGLSPTVVSYNALISGHSNRGLLNSAMNLKNSMGKKGVHPDVVTYNTLIHGFCKEGKLGEANKMFNEMKVVGIAANTVTYNILINAYSKLGNTEMGNMLYEQMSSTGVKTDILTYNALIMGLCKEGKTKKAAHLVKELDKDNLIPNSATFSALITGQCMRNNSERAFQFYKSMIRSGCHPDRNTFQILISAFFKNKDFDGGFQVLKEMLKRSIAPDKDILYELCSRLHRFGKDDLVMTLCKELEAARLVPEGFSVDGQYCQHQT